MNKKDPSWRHETKEMCIEAITETVVFISVFCRILICKLTSTCPKLFCFLMLLPVFLAPEVVAQLVDNNGVHTISQPLFIQYVFQSISFSIVFAVIISGFHAFKNAFRHKNPTQPQG